MVLVGAVMKLDLAWALSDTFNGLMMLPNLVGVVGLSGVVVRETQAYLKRNDPLRPCSLSVRCGMERVILYRFFLFGFGAGRFRLRTASRPAAMPLPKAQCRLKPPQLPAQSSVSPTK